VQTVFDSSALHEQPQLAGNLCLCAS
jgi:hypothetical protein